MKEEYYDQAVACVKDHVLPAQRELYKSCGGDFDKVYGEAMNGNGYFGKVIVPGRVYELGYKMHFSLTACYHKTIYPHLEIKQQILI